MQFVKTGPNNKRYWCEQTQRGIFCNSYLTLYETLIVIQLINIHSHST